MKQCGLHLRLNHSLQELIEKAIRLQLPFFQCFLVSKVTDRLLELSAQEKQAYLAVRRKYFNKLYVHGSYWINLANVKYTNHRVLNRELAVTKDLEFTHLVLHPGSAKGAQKREEGIDALARALNKALKKEHDITLVLENTAHNKMSVGGDLHDFKLLKEKLNHPEKVQFCIDTAHAYSFGYDLIDDVECDKFIDLIGSTVGYDSVALLHLNDTEQELGSYIDRHALVGAGNLGVQTLQKFVQHEKLKNIPALMELPVLQEQEEQQVLTTVNGWF